MSTAALPPIVQRSCALCGTVDDGPRNEFRLASGAVAFYHLDNNGDGISDCPTPNADPHPEIEESVSLSQLRHALESDPGSVTPDPAADLTMATTDAQAGPDAPTYIVQTGQDPWAVDVDDEASAQAAADALRAGRGV